MSPGHAIVIVVRAKRVVIVKVFIVYQVRKTAVALLAANLRRSVVFIEDTEDQKVSLYIPFLHIPNSVKAFIPIQRPNLCQVIGHSEESRLSGVSF
jgi:hypothetical protein